jgi:hypothetical protein
MEHHSRGNYPKQEKSSLKSETTVTSKAPKPLKINEIDSTQEIRMDTTDRETGTWRRYRS